MNNYEEQVDLYHNLLFDSKFGKSGRKYLNTRKIKKNTAIFWKLGYLPFNYLKNNTDYQMKKMEGRITIPIYDSNGILVSIAGRSVYPALKPKYLHYSFPTSTTLFGLYQNKYNIAVKQHAIVTEGQMDVIMSWQNGLDNVVSSFGTKFSYEHLVLLSRYCDNINILYDADNAGEIGMNNAKKFSDISDVKINIKKDILLKDEDLDLFFKEKTLEDFYNIFDDKQRMLQKIKNMKKNF